MNTFNNPLPPGRYRIGPDGVVRHENGEPVSLTEEQHKLIAAQVAASREREICLAVSRMV